MILVLPKVKNEIIINCAKNKVLFNYMHGNEIIKHTDDHDILMRKLFINKLFTPSEEDTLQS